MSSWLTSRRRSRRAEGRAISTDWSGGLSSERHFWILTGGSIDLGTAAHEMIHQLAADSGLLPHHDAFPTWLHEGFAAQFEVIRGGRWAGIGRPTTCDLPTGVTSDPRETGATSPRRRLRPWLPARTLCSSLGFGLLPAHRTPWAVPDVHRPASQS